MIHRPSKPTLLAYYRRMFAHFGPLHWWPAESPFEVAVGAILTQNTAWSNVEKAIRNLKRRDLLDPTRLYALPERELAELIRPSGYFNIKAKKLRAFLRFLHEEHGGELSGLFALGQARARERLLAVWGIGPETADSILLYAGELPVFVVDAYTKRIFSRHGLLRGDEGYEEVRAIFEGALGGGALYNEYHAQVVYTGKEFCRKRPRCEGCPLRDLLPKGGPMLAGGAE